MPGYLASQAAFSRDVSTTVMKARHKNATAEDHANAAVALKQLHKHVLPFILRRLKANVLKELPPKVIQVFMQYKLPRVATPVSQQHAPKMMM